MISGNGTGIQIRTSASGTKVQNNYIGLNAAGTAAIFNGARDLDQQQRRRATRSAASAAGEGNVISGNNGTGINVQTGSNGNIIQGNLIGLDAGGTSISGTRATAST